MNKEEIKEKLNKIFSKNPDFVFYDYDNECVGKDLLDLILEIRKAEQENIIKEIDEINFYGWNKDTQRLIKGKIIETLIK